ncbi:ADP-ribosylglycohydrolase family protein [Actinoplanes sp. LDG1-06]|uniref:ADP-ribosylglycohydrolase family protein n=1 Tax=Paractinoplanes ovalisporus TaxID=2810368 RepID=A0ABS2AHC6_9ACTN|nr:ADP-ribosylglycohydrolase family protein [Actinoplanes ovalisporus]MBM2618758.1 ADP-ribosylglycohydrolase family protein [Actinoplanes ovalisporus]
MTIAAARGCILGLLLGDALGAAKEGAATKTAGAATKATSAGQLACFTVEGIIRASVRASHHGGISHPPGVVWNAYLRWATIQGIPGVPARDKNGWLAHVPALAERRGSAPATVAALQGITERTSTGAHALTRTLPAGLVALWGMDAARLAHGIAATTHADEAADVAAMGATAVAALAQGRKVEIDLPEKKDERAVSALAGGIAILRAFPRPDQVRDALVAAVAKGPHVATVAGALLGTAHGVDALPVDWVSRLELAWVGDVLARDLVAEFEEHPSGSEYEPAPDGRWWNRYPGG